MSTSYATPSQSPGESKSSPQPSSESNDQSGPEKVVKLTTKQEPPDIDDDMEEGALSIYEGSERDQMEERDKDDSRLSAEDTDNPEVVGKSSPPHEDSNAPSMLAKSLTSYRSGDAQGM